MSGKVTASLREKERLMALTKIGLDYLERRIRDTMIQVPGTMDSNELLGWINGYKQCEDNVFALIAELRETELHGEETNAYLMVLQSTVTAERNQGNG